MLQTVDKLLGYRNENKILKHLLKKKYPNTRKVIQTDLKKNQNIQYSFFDFINEDRKNLYELKSILKKSKYNCSFYYLGLDKILTFNKSKYKKMGYSFLVFYSINDILYYHKLDTENYKTTYEIENYNRTDRKGVNDINKKYIKIKKQMLKRYSFQFLKGLKKEKLEKEKEKLEEEELKNCLFD